MNSLDHYLVFSLDRRRHALPLSVVERVIRAVEIMPLPNSADDVLGVINVQGRIIPVLSLRKRFGLEERPVHPEDQIIITSSVLGSVSLLVDAALGVITLPRSLDLFPEDTPPCTSQSQQVITVDEEMVLFHKPERLIEAKPFERVTEALQL
ncbi:MAG: chemotaxis protein CheW [Blastocatellia bacterium AA13]|nr:MAG: chemotaxis protein CheW [Blastocatellia bacterium AA13]